MSPGWAHSSRHVSGVVPPLKERVVETATRAVTFVGDPAPTKVEEDPCPWS